MSLSDATGQTANMTGTEKTDCYSARQRKPEENGELTWVDDAFDETYEDKDDAALPPLKIVWRNVVLMTLLHIGAVYGLTIVPSAKPFTLVWGRFASFFLDYSMRHYIDHAMIMVLSSAGYSAVYSGCEGAFRSCLSDTLCLLLENREQH